MKLLLQAAALALVAAPAPGQTVRVGTFNKPSIVIAFYRSPQWAAGEASLDDILEALAPALPEIARKAQLSLIAADVPHSDASVQMVDITGALLDWLKADERTQAIIAEMRSHPGRVPPVHQQ